MQRFTNKTILITGGNSGMGFATAKRIIEEGGRVIVTGRDEKTLQQAQAELGAQADVQKIDSSRLPELDKLYAHIQKKYGQIDGIFANAGIAIFNTVENVTEEEFDKLYDINVKGVFFTLQKGVKLLKPGSAVLLNSSVTGVKGGTTNSVYASTKAAVRSMARTFSSSYVGSGVRFNVISPGPIATPIWDRPSGIPAEALEGTKKAIADANPMKRYGSVDEITAAITFLLSSESSYILGAELFVDGGMTQL